MIVPTLSHRRQNSARPRVVHNLAYTRGFARVRLKSRGEGRPRLKRPYPFPWRVAVPPDPPATRLFPLDPHSYSQPGAAVAVRPGACPCRFGRRRPARAVSGLPASPKDLHP